MIESLNQQARKWCSLGEHYEPRWWQQLLLVQDATGEQLLVNTIGPYAGIVLLDKEDGQNTSRLKVQSDGSWHITLSPIAAAPRFETTAKGNGDAVLVYTGSAAAITMTHSGRENCTIWAHGEDTGQDLLVNKIGRYSGQNVIGNGPVVLQVAADGRWTLAVSYE